MTINSEVTTFRDRNDAGRQLARALHQYRDDPGAIVLALPRGGVVVGYEVSLALHLPLDVLVVRKLGTPFNPELAMGALAETGYRHLNADVIASYDIGQQEIEEEVQRQQKEIDRRIAKYRARRTLPPLKGRTVIVVDDGIATGATFFASLAALRSAEAAKLVAAVPMAPPEAVVKLTAQVDEVVVLHTPEWFFGISQFYDSFPQVEDVQVMACLDQVRASMESKRRTTS